MARAIILILAISWLAAGPLPSDEPAQKLTVAKDLLYTVPKGVEVQHDSPRGVGKHWAYRCKRGGKMFVVADGVVQKTYDYIDFIVYSPDGQHYAYAARRGQRQVVVVDGVEQRAYDKVSRPDLSPDGTRCAYAARSGRKWFFVVDGAEQKAYDSEWEGFYNRSAVFSPDGKRFAYAAESGGKVFVVLDGVELGGFDNVRELSFSPDSKRFAYAAEGNGGTCVVVDSDEGNKYKSVHDLTFSPNGRRLAFTAWRPDYKQLVVLDGVEQAAYDPGDRGIVVRGVVFSPDSEHIAYEVDAGGGSRIVFDGVEQEAPHSMWAPMFSPHGGRFAYRGLSGDKHWFVVDGVEHGRYDYVSDPVFSPDSRRFAYCARQGDYTTGTSLIVMDGEEQASSYWVVTSPAFSRNSEHFAYAAASGDERLVVLDGVEQERMTRIYGPSPGEGSDVFVWYAWVGRQWAETKWFWWQPGSKLYRFVARYEDGKG